MSAGTVLRWGEVWLAFRAIVNERPKALLGYLAAAVLIPWLFFYLYPQSNMRGFGALALNDYNITTPETGRTAIGMFVIAFVMMAAFIFAAWSALLTEVRDEISGELMAGFVNALLSSLVIFMIVALLIFGPSIILGIALRASPNPTPAASLLVSLTPLSVLLMAMLLLARLGLTGPVMAAEGSINPFFGLKRSWQLTRGHFGKMLLVITPIYLFFVIAIALFLAIAGAVLSATDGTTWHDNALSAGWLAVQTLLVFSIIVVPAALYRAIRPAINTEVFA